MKHSSDELPQLFRTADVAALLGIEEWRVRNFSEGKAYGLPPSFRVGKGQGSRRLYIEKDILKLSVAHDLVESGFTAKAVGKAIKLISAPDAIASLLANLKAGKTRVLACEDGEWKVVTPAEARKLFDKSLGGPGGMGGVFGLNLINPYERYIWRIRKSGSS